jgi:hypothetical protein
MKVVSFTIALLAIALLASPLLPEVTATRVCVTENPGGCGTGCAYVSEEGCLGGVGVIEDPNTWRPILVGCQMNQLGYCAIGFGPAWAACVEVLPPGCLLAVGLSPDNMRPLICF